MLLKICGITRLEDAEQAVAAGATAVGFVFWPRSPRCITPERAGRIVAALPANVMAVGVFVDETLHGIRRAVADAGLTTVQLHGDEPPELADALGLPLLRSTTIDRLEAGGAGPADTTFLLDAADPVRRGGTGRPVDWGRAARLARTHRVVLAGGLTPENVAEAIAQVRPFGVDVSSGVEQAPGVKDAGKMSQFLARARAAFAGGATGMVIKG